MPSGKDTYTTLLVYALLQTETQLSGEIITDGCG
jgi:hypothetical protein